MKRTILLAVLFFLSLTLSAKEPLIKFYLQDGNIKEYKINELDKLSFIHSNLSYSMTVFQKGLIPGYKIDIRGIDSIVFSNNQIMKVFQPNKMETFSLLETDSIIFIFNECEDIQIGNQIWMCKNLDVDNYRNGDPIPEVKDSKEWANLKTGAWCFYNNDTTLGKIYGKLYNWYAVNDQRGLSPDGWHVPSDSEWTTLSNYLGGKSIAGGKLKETGTSHWLSPNIGATNETSFSAIPGGWCYSDDGTFHYINRSGYWWSSSECNATFGWCWYMYYNYKDISRGSDEKSSGFSVRCIKD
jgi:uncharacterized protein (TIGR02145 family)